MKTLASTITGAAVALFLLCLSQAASAQISNQPFAFGGNPGAGVPGTSGLGMSPAYREVILERKLLGRSTSNNFIRGADGSLVNVERKGDQAYARPVTTPFAASQSSFSLSGFGYGGSGGGSVDLLRAAIARPTDPASEDMPAVAGTAPGAVPINSWIMQLTTLPELAS
ncbi:MAG TPA: hypothetical protein VGO34_03770 [Alphaproteobacteria bacterium]|jgi:hypothetical protein